MQVSLNAANVIPGLVEMSLDIRDLSSQHIDNLMEQLRLNIEGSPLTLKRKSSCIPVYTTNLFWLNRQQQQLLRFART